MNKYTWINKFERDKDTWITYNWKLFTRLKNFKEWSIQGIWEWNGNILRRAWSGRTSPQPSSIEDLGVRNKLIYTTDWGSLIQDCSFHHQKWFEFLFFSDFRVFAYAYIFNELSCINTKLKHGRFFQLRNSHCFLTDQITAILWFIPLL